MLVVIAVVVVAVVLRSIPILLAPRGAGIDHWYWKSYVDAYRRERRFPPVLPQYILELHQWYPPLFPMLLANLPSAILDRFDSLVAIAIDLFRLALLLSFAYWVTGNIETVAMAGLLYATAPIQISYNTQLNPRGLAALMLDGVLLLLLVQLDGPAPLWVWVVIVMLGGLILLTHKMTTQLFCFLVGGTAVIYQSWALLLLIPAAMLTAVVFSRGFYLNVLRAHWDIVSFWNRNWPWIGADLIRESPVYGDGQYERAVKLHPKGLRGAAQQAVTLFGFNPAAWMGCLLAYERLWLDRPLVFFPSYLLVWLLLTCGGAVLTTYVRQFKCLGAGYLYLYNSSLLASLLLGIAFEQTLVPGLSQAFVLIALCGNVAGTLVYYRHFRGNKRMRVHEGLDDLIGLLRDLPRGVVMCIPGNWYEVVAYRTGQPVLWGGHGYGFRLLEPTFPRLLLPIREILERYDVRYLVTMEGMLTAKVMSELPDAETVTRGEYQLYAFRIARPEPEMAGAAEVG